MPTLPIPVRFARAQRPAAAARPIPRPPDLSDSYRRPCRSQPAPKTFHLPDKPIGYVNDYAHVLSSAARQQLDALCTEVNDKAKAQIFVVIVPISGRSHRRGLFLRRRYQMGRRSRSKPRSGVLIFLAMNDHKYWTQVGYGLEPILPDGKVGGFGREMVPISVKEITMQA